jgi:lysophospholipase
VSIELCSIPENPIPGRPEVFTILARDGVGLRVARWAARGVARGTVLVVQGRSEFIEKYAEVVGMLLARGFAVVAFDWRGQGGSQRLTDNPRKGHVRRFSDYRLDLSAVVEQVLPDMPAPIHVLAHSMGAALMLDAAHELAPRGPSAAFPFARMVLSAPMIEIVGAEPDRLRPRWTAMGARLLGLGRSFVPQGGETATLTRPFAGNPLSSDPVRYARNAELAAACPHLAIGDPTIDWAAGAMALTRRLAQPRLPLGIVVPTLVVAAGADTIVSSAAIERFCARLKAGRVIVLPGARHEILIERAVYWEAFWRAFDAFVPGSDAAREPPASAGEDGERGLVHAAVAGGDDGAAALG